MCARACACHFERLLPSLRSCVVYVCVHVRVCQGGGRSTNEGGERFRKDGWIGGWVGGGMGWVGGFAEVDNRFGHEKWIQGGCIGLWSL
jgi:hypothetical protein